MNHKIKTNNDTLKNAWNILKEVNLDSLLTGGQIENIDIAKLIDTLLLEGTLEKFITTVATLPDDTTFGDMEWADTVGIATAFFTNFAQPLKGLGKVITTQ